MYRKSHLKSWFDTYPEHFRSSLFTNWCKYKYFDDEKSKFNNIDGIMNYLMPFNMFDPKDLKLIMLFEGSTYSDNSSGLGIGTNDTISESKTISDIRLKSTYRSLITSYDDLKHKYQFDFSLKSIASQNVLILNEISTDDNFGIYSDSDPDIIINRLILRSILESISKKSDAPIVIESDNLDYISKFDINNDIIHPFRTIFKATDSYFNNKNEDSIKWYDNR